MMRSELAIGNIGIGNISTLATLIQFIGNWQHWDWQHFHIGNTHYFASTLKNWLDAPSAGTT